MKNRVLPLLIFALPTVGCATSSLPVGLWHADECTFPTEHGHQAEDVHALLEVFPDGTAIWHLWEPDLPPPYESPTPMAPEIGYLKLDPNEIVLNRLLRARPRGRYPRHSTGQWQLNPDETLFVRYRGDFGFTFKKARHPWITVWHGVVDYSTQCPACAF